MAKQLLILLSVVGLILADGGSHDHDHDHSHDHAHTVQASVKLVDPQDGYAPPTYGAPPAAPPTYGAPAPSYDAPEPAYGAPAPAYDAPEPAYGAPEPAYGAPAPSYDAPEPAYGAPEEAYGAPSYGYDYETGYEVPASEPLVPSLPKIDFSALTAQFAPHLPVFFAVFLGVLFLPLIFPIIGTLFGGLLAPLIALAPATLQPLLAALTGQVPLGAITLNLGG